MHVCDRLTRWQGDRWDQIVSKFSIDGWVYFPLSFTSKIKLTTKWNKTSAMLYFLRTYWSSNCTFIWDRGAVDMPSFLQSNKQPPLVASLEEYLRWQQLTTCDRWGVSGWNQWPCDDTTDTTNESQSLERNIWLHNGGEGGKSFGWCCLRKVEPPQIKNLHPILGSPPHHPHPKKKV